MTLTQSLHRNARQQAAAIATIDGDRRRTWAQVRERVARFAGGLAALGIQPGDRVALLAGNSDHYFDYLFACWWLGAVVNPVNIRWSAQEIAYSLVDSGTKLLFVAEDFAHLLPEIRALAPAMPAIRPIGDAAHEQWLAGCTPVADQRVDGDAIAAILYTGGTTGFPKGVMLSHRNMVASALGVTAMPGCRSSGCCLHVPPLFHIGALAGLLLAVLAGSSNAFLPGFDAEPVLEAIARERVSEIFLVPTMLRMLLDHPRFGQYDLQSLRLIRYGASSIDDALLDRALAAFPQAGFVQAYGMTELSPVATILAPEDHLGARRAAGKTRTAGRATPVVEVRITGPDGAELPAGEIGEITVRGDTVMPGYWGQPETTAEALRDGWMHTGDLGSMDADGYVTIVDRLKDLIISGGENIYSAEVENALASHPAVAHAAVIGVPDLRWGERVHAVIVAQEEQRPTAEELQQHVRARIAAYKIPRSFTFTAALPMSAAGKVLKNRLREQAAATE